MADSNRSNARVLVLTNNIGGLYSFRKEVLKAIVETGAEVFVSYPDADERLNYFEELGCCMIPLEFNGRGVNPFQDIQLIYRYVRLIRRYKPDIVLSYTVKPNIYGGIACRLCGRPQLPNITGLGDAVENSGLLCKILIALYRVSLRNAKTVFFQNESNLKFFMQNKILRSSYILLPGSGVNLDMHTYQEYPDNEKIKFLLIARVIKDKGIEEYLEMAQEISARHTDTEFQILGSVDSTYQSEIDRLVKDGIIRYLGTTTDVRPFLQAVNCTVLPSYHEGMSNVNLESQANGRPVITTDVPGCKETIEDQVTGYLVNPRDSEDLIEKVEKFILLSHNEKREMGVAGRRYVENNFSRQIVVDRYLGELKMLKIC